jgi:hypothetical protein
MWRRKYSSKPNDYYFELKLAKSAKEAMETRKFGAEKKKTTNSARDVIMNVTKRSVSMLRDEETTTDEKSSSLDIESADGSSDSFDLALFSFHRALKDQHAYFGIKDVFIKGGIVRLFDKPILSLPPGLFEDFVFYACNNINPLPFLFGDEEHPTSLLSRYVVYCNSQVFTLTIYLLVPKSSRMFVNFCLSPIVLFFEFWLNRLVACPCLQSGHNYDGGADVQQQKKGQETCEIWGKRMLRVVGGLLSLPLLLVMVTFLILLAYGLANNTIHGRLLGRFVFDGIILPFFIKVLMTSISFCYKLHPHHVNMCGVNVFKINHWTELQFIEEDISQHELLSVEEVKDKRRAHWIKSHGEASIFHMNCYCLRYIGLPIDPNYRIDVCHPSCYCARCCNAISELYWKVPSDASQYPIRNLSQSKYNTMEDRLIELDANGGDDSFL